MSSVDGGGQTSEEEKSEEPSSSISTGESSKQLGFCSCFQNRPCTTSEPFGVNGLGVLQLDTSLEALVYSRRLYNRAIDMNTFDLLEDQVLPPA